jgi:hypothetical protein
LLCVLALAMSGVAIAALEPLLLGGRHQLAAGETHPGSLTAVAGVLRVDDGARIDGSLTVVGGRLELDGAVGGTVHAYGATVRLGDGAVVDGGLELTASELERAPGAIVRGSVRRDEDWPVRFGAPQEVERWLGSGRTMPWAVPLGPLGPQGFAFSVLIQAGLLALAAFVLARLVPQRLRRIADDATGQPLAAGLHGLLAAVVAAVVAAAFAITLIGIPLAMLVGLAAWAAGALGLAALSDRLGERVGPQGGDRGARAALGGFLVGVGWAAAGAVPILGAPLRTVVGVVAFGAVVRTRAGGGTEPPTAPADDVPANGGRSPGPEPRSASSDSDASP